jgi:hypothetical protein
VSHVDDLLVAAVAVIRRWGASHNRDVGAPRWLDAMLEALVAAEVIRPAGADDWRARAIDERARGAGPIEIPAHVRERAAALFPDRRERWADPVAGALEQMGALPEEPPGRRADGDLLTPAPGFRLGDSLIAPGEAPRVLVPETQPDGATVLCVALFAQCFLVHGISRPTVASRQADFRAEDDAGTWYLPRQGAAGGPEGTTGFAYVFSGGVPAEASRLTITLGRWGAIDVDVRR